MLQQDAQKLAVHVQTFAHQYLKWAGLGDTAQALITECSGRGEVIPDTQKELAIVDDRTISSGSRTTHTRSPSKELIKHFDDGQGAKFFQLWSRVRNQYSAPLEFLTLEFYIHVYFSTLPLRHGHQQDHVTAMAVFRRFLEACPTRVGQVQDLLPFYALPYVPDPQRHPAFTPVFQDSWVKDLRGKLERWINRCNEPSSRPQLLTLLDRNRHHHTSVGAALVAQESAATAVRSQRALRRRLHRLNDDYSRLVGVSWELTQALEAAVQGERVDLESTLAACTHRYPELFTLSLTADTS
ncbi:unnamed protein product, partial [Meganyctiphanes norvegica]